MKNMNCILLLTSHIQTMISAPSLQQPLNTYSWWIYSVSPLSSMHCVCEASIFSTEGFRVILTVAQLQELFSRWGQRLKAPLWVILTGIHWKMMCEYVCACVFVCVPVSKGFRQRVGCSWPKREIIKLIELFRRNKRCDSPIVLHLIVPVGSF